MYCENENGEKFIVELQKSKQNWFKERTIYYSTFPIRVKVEKGDLSYNLHAVFCIGILDFVFNDYEDETEKQKLLHEIKLRNQDGKVFYDKLTFVYLEMPKFNKTENELITRLDKWLFFIKNLKDFNAIPEIFKDEVVFKEAFNIAKISYLTVEQLEAYQYSIKAYRDMKGLLDSATDNGKKQGIDSGIDLGRKEQQKKMAINCIKRDLDIKTIKLLTELAEEEILELIKEDN